MFGFSFQKLTAKATQNGPDLDNEADLIEDATAGQPQPGPDNVPFFALPNADYTSQNPGAFSRPTLSLLETGAASSGAGGSSSTGTTSTSLNSTGTAAPAAWISTLQDSGLRADMTSASAGGTVSEAGLAKLFADLSMELSTAHTTLSASQLSDLKTIASELNVGESASSYLSYITSALINGNAANANWTGGAASSTALGNLAVGSTATQIAELNGKWFLGTDLPSSSVRLSGEPTFSVSYSAVSNPLFGVNGPSMSDVNQGYLGDCYLMSSLAEVAQQNPSVIQSLITNNGNNTYGVRFFVAGTAEYVTVDDALADGGTVFNYATNIWASLVEKAYAQIQASGVITGNNVNYGNSFSTIGNGGAPEFALEEITGATAITDFDANGSSWNKYVYNDVFYQQSSSSGLTTSSVLSTLVSDLAAGYDEILSSVTNATDSNGNLTLVADHALSIYGYDSSTGDLEVRNPWGTESGQTWDTTFEVSLNTLLGDGDTISVDNVSTASSSKITPAVQSDFMGTGTSDILLQNSTDAFVDWIVANGAVTAGNGLGTASGWNAVATGDFSGNGVSDILLQNSAGTLVDWMMNGGTVASGSAIGNTVGYNVVGTGDFNGDGTTDILLQNNAGTVVDWTLANGAVTGGNMLGTASGWKVAGTGDFNGDGTSDILLVNSAGTVVDWTMNNGTVASGAVMGNTGGYNIVGTGDFTGSGTSDILLQNSTGTLVDWIVKNGAITAGNDLGNAAGWSVAAIGDYNGNGTSDILLTNSAGTVVEWAMNNGTVSGGSVIGNTAGFSIKA